jgi:putative tryptophan/tyrosine transport system substrate-binding protein
MTKQILGFVLSAMLFALGGSAQAQQPAKIPRIGFLVAVSPSAAAARTEAYRQGLRDLGYLEGKNIVIESRYAEGKLDRLPALAAELVSLKVDIIVTAGGQATRAAKEATPTIPIIMTNDPDPVGSGFVASLARPGGNITGLSTLAPEVSGKRLELLREIVPKLSRVAVLGSSTQPAAAQTSREVELAAETLKLKLQYTDVRGPKDIETAFRAASKGRVEAVLVLAGPSLGAHRTQIQDAAVKNRLPAIYPQIEYTEAGGLAYYGASTPDLDRRAATYVDKILKGAKPADLPVRTAHKVRVHHQSESGEADRSDDSAERAGESGSSH